MAKPELRNFEVLELTLTLLAVIAGSVAATGSFLGASYERDRVELERRPAVLLACEPEYRARDIAEATRPPARTVLLTDRGARWIHIAGSGQDEPQPFARCTLTSYGRLPVFNLRIPLEFQVLPEDGAEPKTVDSSFDVAGLSPSTPFPFGLVNGARAKMKLKFEPTLLLTPVDSGTATVETLFLDEGLRKIQQRVVDPEDTG